MTHEELQIVRYSTTMTLEDVKNQLRRGKTTMYDPIVVDSWQFIIIDREIGLPFQLMDIVQDALLMLCGDPSPRQVAKRVIREIIPASVQEIFLEEITIRSAWLQSQALEIPIASFDGSSKIWSGADLSLCHQIGNDHRRDLSLFRAQTAHTTSTFHTSETPQLPRSIVRLLYLSR
jgi:hypothetical protein